MLAGMPPAHAWTVVPREGTYGVGIQFRDGRWDGRLLVPTQAHAPSLGSDKVQHVLAGAVIATFMRLNGYESSTALGMALLAGTMKEIGDTGRLPGIRRGNVEFADWVATGLGGLLGVWSTQEEGRALSDPASARDGT